MSNRSGYVSSPAGSDLDDVDGARERAARRVARIVLKNNLRRRKYPTTSDLSAIDSRDGTNALGPMPLKGQPTNDAVGEYQTPGLA